MNNLKTIYKHILQNKIGFVETIVYIKPRKM